VTLRRPEIADQIEYIAEPQKIPLGDHAHLADRKAFAAFLRPWRKVDWVVYAKEPFGGAKQVLCYLSRYTHRVAISNRRLIAAD
jgi:hypothetical protein